MSTHTPLSHGRGSNLNPPNRFGVPLRVIDGDYLDQDADAVEALEHPTTQYLPDQSGSVISENSSPDVGFNFSLNPYRGCQHGCSYCFARPTHEYLGWNAGLDFETKILVKHDAPALFESFLARDKWVPEPIALSGVTDPYQPAERTYQLTRQCLQVAAEANQPISIITKNALITRDLDILGPMAEKQLIRVNVSITTLDAELARSMEPRTSTPAARLRAIKELSQAGVPVRVLNSPIIPGLNDHEIPTVLAAAKEAGVLSASFILLRLPLTVVPVFFEWVDRTRPEARAKIEGRVRTTRGGELYQSEFGRRMHGTGEIADQIRNLFKMFVKKYGLDQEMPPFNYTRFRPPRDRHGQGRLF